MFDLPKTAFHGDESWWITTAFHYEHLLHTGNFNNTAWDSEFLGDWGNLNLHAAKLVLGIPLARLNPHERFRGLYNFDKSYQENEAAGMIPPRKLLLQARFICSVLGAMGCAWCTLIGWKIGRLPGAIITFLLVVANPLFRESATRVRTDAMYTCFMLATAWMAIGLVGARTKPRRKAYLVLTAVCIAIGCSVKVTALPLNFLFVGLVLFIQFLLGNLKFVKLVKECAICFGIALFLIYAFAPNLWPDVRSIRPAACASEARRFVVDPHVPGVDTWARLNAYPQLANLAVPLKLPMMFPAWKRSLTHNADMHPKEKWPTPRFWSFTSAVFIKSASFPGEIIFFLVGSVLTIARFKNAKRDGIEPAFVLLIFVVVNYLFGLAFQPLIWARWFLPTVIAAMPIAAIPITIIFSRLIQQIRPKGNVNIPQ